MNPRDYMIYKDEIKDNCFRFSNGYEIKFKDIEYEISRKTKRLEINVFGIDYSDIADIYIPLEVILQADYGINHIRIKLEKEMFLNADDEVYNYLANKLINSFGNYMFGGEK